MRVLVGQLRGGKSRKKSAQEELWRGQCGDAYWHGNGGGLLNLPIRAAAYSSLIEAERITRSKGIFSPGIIRADLDFDGEKEILYQGSDYNAYIKLEDASLAEFDSFRSLTNYVNAMEGAGRLHCFVDIIGRSGHFGRPKDESDQGRYYLVDGAKSMMSAEFSAVFPAHTKNGTKSLRVGKTFAFRKANVGVHYCLSNESDEPVSIRFSTILNMTLGNCLEAMALRLDGQLVSIGSSPENMYENPSVDSFLFENRSGAEKLEFRSERAFAMRLEPIYMKAEIGGKTERLFQGSRVRLGWDLIIAARSDELISVNLELTRL